MIRLSFIMHFNYPIFSSLKIIGISNKNGKTYKLILKSVTKDFIHWILEFPNKASEKEYEKENKDHKKFFIFYPSTINKENLHSNKYLCSYH